jgi:hypothetical protein
LDDAKYISDFAAKEGCDLVIGVAMNDGMPGEVLRSFRDNNRIFQVFYYPLIFKFYNSIL